MRVILNARYRDQFFLDWQCSLEVYKACQTVIIFQGQPPYSRREYVFPSQFVILN